MSLLSLVTSVARRVKIPAPVSVVNSTDSNIQQLFELANEEGYELSRAKDWQALVGQNVFTTTATQVQTGAIPANLRGFIADSFWNRTTNRKVIGPITPQKWQQLVAFPSISAPNLAWRERSGQWLFYPAPPAGQTIAYEFVTNAWAQTAAGGSLPAYTVDTDISMLDEVLMALGVRWRFKHANGLDYAEDFRTYETQKAQAMARDGGSAVIPLGGMVADYPDEARLLTGQGSFPG